MVVTDDRLKTEVTGFTYEKSSIHDSEYLPSSAKLFRVKSVTDNECHLVEIVLPTGESMVVKADQIITAIQKCVR